MTSRALTLIAAFVFAASASAEGRGLAELVTLAESHDAEYAAAKAEYAAQEENVNSSRTTLLPQASAVANRAVSGNDMDDVRSARVQVRQNFSLRNLQSFHTDELRFAAQTAQLRAALQSLRARVVRGWLRAQLAADTLVLLAARKKTLREQQARAEKLRVAGSGLEADVLRASARLFDIDAQIARAQNELSVARDELLRITGALPSREQMMQDANFPPPPNLKEWQNKTAAGSPRREAAMATRAAAESSLRAAEKAVFPELDVSLESGSDNKLKNFEEQVRFVLTQPLFTSGRISAEKRRLMASLRAADSRLLAVRREEVRQTRERIGAIGADLAGMRALSAAVEASSAALDATVVGYQGGARTIADVLLAEEDLFDARLQLRRAQYNYLENLTLLRELAGGVDGGFVREVARFFAPAGQSGA